MSNSKQWSSKTPGYLIFLVDQSSSMSQDWQGGKTQAEMTALVINRTINDIIFTNTAGEKVKDRVFISILGYGGSPGVPTAVTDIRSDYLSQYAESPLRIDKIKRKVSDGAGGLVEIEDIIPVFIEPQAEGLTPMGEALDFARDLINEWVSKYPDNPAPIVINISDGLPYNGHEGEEEDKARRVAREIMNIQTADGNPVILNIHISGEGEEVLFPLSQAELKGDPMAELLFDITSQVPDSFLQAASKFELPVKNNCKGFIANAKKPETLIKFINFGSSGDFADPTN